MNKEIPLINNYILFKVMGKKKYNPKYIEDATKRIEQILNDTQEFDDWTQICFSMKDAVHAAATVYGRNSDELVHKLNGFVLEMVAKAVSNINKYDITFQKKQPKVANPNMKIIAVLDFSCNSIDIIHVTAEELAKYEDEEEFLSERCQYNPSNIQWMSGDESDITLNLHLTPDDFG